MTMNPSDEVQIGVVVAHAFGKKVAFRFREQFKDQTWRIVPFIHEFDFDLYTYVATDEQFYARPS